MKAYSTAYRPTSFKCIPTQYQSIHDICILSEQITNKTTPIILAIQVELG